MLRLAQAVFPHMAARKRGTFVTIGSLGGEVVGSVSNLTGDILPNTDVSSQRLGQAYTLQASLLFMLSPKHYKWKHAL